MAEEHGLPERLSYEDVVQRLKDLRDYKLGNPEPWWFSGPNSYAVVIAALAKDAVYYLELNAKDWHDLFVAQLEKK